MHKHTKFTEGQTTHNYHLCTRINKGSFLRVSAGLSENGLYFTNCVLRGSTRIVVLWISGPSARLHHSGTFEHHNLAHLHRITRDDDLTILIPTLLPNPISSLLPYLYRHWMCLGTACWDGKLMWRPSSRHLLPPSVVELINHHSHM